MQKQDTNNYCLDSSIWLGYIRGESDEIRLCVEREILATSSLALLEVADRCLHYGKTEKETEVILKFISSKARIVTMNKEISLRAAKIKNQQRKMKKPKFGIVDAAHKATAEVIGATFLTKDNDFIGMNEVKILK